ncbi:MAG: hypothetical protein WDO18_09550 [Acidobacteriota bacterium]
MKLAHLQLYSAIRIGHGSNARQPADRSDVERASARREFDDVLNTDRLDQFAGVPSAIDLP